ncbi:MAG: hypothetical protein JKY80_05250 [Mariprofundaceae bacterium]|nr:hypothetical protein [Mariprofundaceae bacterium]
MDMGLVAASEIEVLPNRMGIDERPGIVNQKTRVRDWEGGTIIGKDHKGAIVSLDERMSKYTLLEKVGGKRADLVTNAETRL